MSERRHRRRHSRQNRRYSPRIWLSFIAAHPWRLAFSAFLALTIGWLILTKSIPYALATRNPDIALALNPNNSRALIAKAESLRMALLSSITVERGQSEETAAHTIARLPKAQDVPGEETATPSTRQLLRSQIRELASRAIVNDPLNATAYRLLAEVTDAPDRVRNLMQEAVKRSRRESIALFWLLNDSYSRKDWPAAIDNADILLRISPDIAKYVMSYLAAASHDPEGRVLLAEKLAAGPSWRRDFLRSFNELFDKDQTALAVIAELKKTKRPASTQEIGIYINHLVWTNATDVAYNLWLQTLPPERLSTLGLLTNAGFETDPGNFVLFDWFVGLGQNSVAEFVPSGLPGGQRLFHVSFGEGRIKFPEVAQVLILPPGRYRLEGRLRGSIISKRGLRWQLSCYPLNETVLGELEMLVGRSEQWRVFTLEAEVPQSRECKGQLLRLFHDSRSASEEFISGEAWFGGLRLEHVAVQTP